MVSQIQGVNYHDSQLELTAEMRQTLGHDRSRHSLPAISAA